MRDTLYLRDDKERNRRISLSLSLFFSLSLSVSFSVSFSLRLFLRLTALHWNLSSRSLTETQFRN